MHLYSYCGIYVLIASPHRSLYQRHNDGGMVECLRCAVTKFYRLELKNEQVKLSNCLIFSWAIERDKYSWGFHSDRYCMKLKLS